jgi:hypothetical protein
MKLGKLLYEDKLSKEKLKSNLFYAICFFIMFLFFGIGFFYISLTTRGTPIWVGFIFLIIFPFGLGIYPIINFFQHKNRIKVYENAIVFTSKKNSKNKVIEYSSIEHIFFPIDGKYIELFITHYNPHRKKWININFVYDTNYIENKSKLRKILRDKSKIYERKSTKEDLTNWEKAKLRVKKVDKLM